MSVISSSSETDRGNLAAVIAAFAWENAAGGNAGAAYLAYSVADSLWTQGHLNADLSLLRHAIGRTNGALVEVVPATEDRVFCFHMSEEVTIESDTSDGLTSAEIDGEKLESNIRQFIEVFNPGFHRKNITKDLPHVLVMSTGRCGTMSLYQLFRCSRLVPYHAYWWQNSASARWEMMCLLMSGSFGSIEPIFQEWLATRAAEWLGPISQNRPMAGLNHLDTICAPAFAAIHPKARFVHLRRNPEAVFMSFFGKRQWKRNQLSPIDYSLHPFRFHWAGYDLPVELAWYFHFTEVFSRAMGRVMGDRYIEVSADKLFAQDRDEIGRLMDFVGADIPLDDAVEHFATPVNAKTHKAHPVPESVREAFREAYCQFS